VGRLLIGPDGTVYRYDDAGRLAEIAPPDGAPTTFEYGDDGLLLVERGPGGGRRFTHDLAGRVNSITVDGVGATTIGYDDAGRRSTETGPDGTRTTYRWNALDQLTAIERTVPDGTTERVTIDVDALGRPQRINGRAVGYDPIAGAPNLVGDVRIVNVGALSWRSDDESWGRTAPGMPEGLRIGGLTVLGARTYDHVTRQFLSPDPLATVPGTNGAASAYTYAWHDPVNHVDPSGLRPISIAEYDAIRQREEQGRLAQAWEAIKEDPWGSLAAVGVVAVGVGLCFTPFAAVGAGILIGAGVSAASGLATGTFDPRAVAVSGVIGGAAGGAGAAFSSTSASLATGGAIGFGGDVAMQAVSGQPINWNRALVSGGVGMVTAGIGSSTSAYTNTMVRSAAAGSATDAGADIVTQALTGDGHIDLGSVAFSALSGGGTSSVTHHLTHANAVSANSTHAATTARFIAGVDGISDSVGTHNSISLGRYPAYIEDAQMSGSRVFNIGDEWASMAARTDRFGGTGSGSEIWIRNSRFLDDAVARHSVIRLASDPFAPENAGSFFLREVDHLASQGFVVSGDRMVPQ
jgi:RHS repeat-associated protein